MTPPATKSALPRAMLCVLLLAALLVISPGIGTESASIGWFDAWRARLGLRISPGELSGTPLADQDCNGLISESEAEDYARLARDIGFRLRFPRTLLALQVGVTLALCGATLQVLLRNALADPYTLGIASGGALGALVAIRTGWVVSFVGISSLSISAFAGALSVVGVVVLIAVKSRRFTSNELLLAGVTLGVFCSAMMMFVTALSGERETFQLVRWMMGSLDPLTSAQQSQLLWPLVLPTWLILILMSDALNQYRFGDDLAASRGVNVARLQWICLLVATLATAAVVARCGPIGFVGLVVPHIVSLLFGSDCRLLLPLSAVLGGVFLILCDWGSQLFLRVAGWALGIHLAGSTLPVGVVTAMVGVPLFLTLLRFRKR